MVSRRKLLVLWTAPAAACLLAFFVAPVLVMLANSVYGGPQGGAQAWTLDFYAKLFSHPIYGRVFVTTVRVAVVTTLIAESRNLGAEHRDLVQRAQLGYVGQWVALLRVLRPEEDPVVSRLKVQAAQMLATSMCRTLYLRRRPGFRRDLAAICLQLQD